MLTLGVKLPLFTLLSALHAQWTVTFDLLPLLQLKSLEDLAPH